MVRKSTTHLLMIAPQPCFDPRGAPYCVLQQIKALLALGYQVDLVTYPMGKALSLPGLRVFRAPALPFIHTVKPGFSLTKLALDLLVFWTAFWRLWRNRYSDIHTHEEGALLGIVLACLFSCKHLYYMHCDLSQLVDHIPFFARLMRSIQRWMVRSADTIVTFYPQLTAYARSLAPGKPVFLVQPPALDEDLPQPEDREVARLRRELALEEGPVLLYTGTLETYQGLEMLLRSAVIVHHRYPTTRYVVVGGSAVQSQKLRALAKRLGVAHIVRFIGQRPLEEMPTFMALADILVSPRCAGTHTPLKLYTYLHSGKPVLATDILSHTQVLDPEIALLVPPTVAGLAEGTAALLQNPLQAHELGLRGRQVALQQYSWPIFLEETRQAYTTFATSA